MPNTKTIILEGGPFDNQFRTVNINATICEVFVPTTDMQIAMLHVLVAKQKVDKSYTRRYYKKSDKKYGALECFVYVKEKPTDNEPNKEGTETT